MADFQLLEVLDLSRNLLVSLDRFGMPSPRLSCAALNCTPPSPAHLPAHTSVDLHRLPRLKHLDVSRNALCALPDGVTKCAALEKLLWYAIFCFRPLPLLTFAIPLETATATSSWASPPTLANCATSRCWTYLVPT